MKALSNYFNQNNFVKLLIISMMIVASSCTKSEIKPDFESTSGVDILIGNVYQFKSNEINYYDNSSHIFYMKQSISTSLQNYADSKFFILSNGEVIYDGTFITLASNSDEKVGTLKYDSVTNPNFALELDHLQNYDATDTSRIDPRNNSAFIAELKRQGIYHEGLKCTIESITNGSNNIVTLTYKIQNSDTWNYYILTPYIMGIDLFHYFTKGLQLFNYNSNERFWNNQEVRSPLFYKEWDETWLTLIKSGESKSFTIQYTNFEPITPGTYWAYFDFPGLSNEITNPNELRLSDGKIWLGKLNVLQKVEIH